jgi:hypothetical protein
LVHRKRTYVENRRTTVENQPKSAAVERVLDCPFCRCAVPYPGLASDGSEPMAECDRCDVYFSFDPEDVYVLGSDNHLADVGGLGDKFHQYGTTEEPGLREK